MRAETQKRIFIAVLVVLALPTGLCSLYFTPIGLIGAFGPWASIGIFVLICSAVGWAICGVSVWGAVRISRSIPGPPPSEPTP